MAKKLNYEVNDVATGADYYYNELLDYRISRYAYENLPDTIPEEILERELAERGTVAIIEKQGNLWALPVNEYGVDVYHDTPPEYITANPILNTIKGKTDYLTTEGVMLYNNKLHKSDYNLIKRYAMMLAQVDSTMDITLVNLRAMAVFVGDDQKTKDDIELFYRKLRAGHFDVLVSKKISVQLQNMMLMPTSNQMQHNELSELYSLRNNIFRQFLRDCGIKTTTEKSQFVSSDEIVNDDILLQYKIKAPLDIRRQCLKKINAKYGTNIQVSINPIIDYPTPEEEQPEEEERSDENAQGEGIN